MSSLSAYIAATMRHAHYKILGDGMFFGEIPECEGLWASDESLEQCRDNLQGALEDWIVIGLHFGDELPVIDGIDINPKREVEA